MSLDAAYQAAAEAWRNLETADGAIGMATVMVDAFLAVLGVDPADLTNAEVRNHAKTCEHGWFIEHDSIETGFCHGGAPLAPVGERSDT